MCRPVPCSKCGKTTWAGCGLHVEALKASVAADRWCLCRSGGNSPVPAPTTYAAPSSPTSSSASRSSGGSSSGRGFSPTSVDLPFSDVFTGEASWGTMPFGRLEEAERWVHHFAPLDMREQMQTSGLHGRLKKAVQRKKSAERSAARYQGRTPDMSELPSTNRSPFATNQVSNSCRACASVAELEILQAGGTSPRSLSRSGSWGNAALVVASGLAFVGSVVTVLA